MTKIYNSTYLRIMIEYNPTLLYETLLHALHIKDDFIKKDINKHILPNFFYIHIL